MLREEQIDAIMRDNNPLHSYVKFARAIEAAVLPEGWVAVPTHPDQNMIAAFIIEYHKSGSSEHNAYSAMLSAAPKPAQCTCRQGQVCGVCDPDLAVPKAQAEKQEPVKDEPVAWALQMPDGLRQIWLSKDSPFNAAVARWPEAYAGAKQVALYTRPQPDLTAEVEFMQGKYEEMLEEWLPQKQRIAELEEAAQQARDALQYHTSQTRPIFNTTEAIIKLDTVLGNAPTTENK